MVQYKLTIMPDPAPNSDPESSFVRMTSTSLTEYTLPSDSCNGRTYQFVVEPLNMCSSPGPRQTVSLSCCKYNMLCVLGGGGELGICVEA